MKCSAFIATSLDGYIATNDGQVDWLHSAGNGSKDGGDLGFGAFIDKVDCMLMGRKTFDTIAAMNLTEEQWPYKETAIWVLSSTLTQRPASIPVDVNFTSDDLPELLDNLQAKGYQHLYADGGSVITQLIELKRLDDLCITMAPILLGSGIKLFGHLSTPINLSQASATAFKSDFVQYHCNLSY